MADQLSIKRQGPTTVCCQLFLDSGASCACTSVATFIHIVSDIPVLDLHTKQRLTAVESWLKMHRHSLLGR